MDQSHHRDRRLGRHRHAILVWWRRNISAGGIFPFYVTARGDRSAMDARLKLFDVLRFAEIEV